MAETKDCTENTSQANEIACSFPDCKNFVQTHEIECTIHSFETLIKSYVFTPDKAERIKNVNETMTKIRKYYNEFDCVREHCVKQGRAVLQSQSVNVSNLPKITL